jgi:polyether ionophore transport system permease protein
MTGFGYGVAADDIAGDTAAVLLVAAVQLPAIRMLLAITDVLYGLAPQFAPVARDVLVVATYLLGSMPEFPHWLLNLVPFTHTQRVPGALIRTAPLMWLLLLDAALIAIGLAAFRRRDLR